MKSLLASISIFLFASFCFAQNEDRKTNDGGDIGLSGTWVLDKSKSDMGLDNGPIKFEWKVKPEFPNTTLVIVHTDSEIRVTENGSAESSVYYTDGRESIVVGNKNSDPKLNVKWKNRKLTIESSVSLAYKINGRDAQMKKIEVWEISKDGKTLTQKISWKPEYGSAPGTSVKVFASGP